MLVPPTDFNDGIEAMEGVIKPLSISAPCCLVVVGYRYLLAGIDLRSGRARGDCLHRRESAGG